MPTRIFLRKQPTKLCISNALGAAYLSLKVIVAVIAISACTPHNTEQQVEVDMGTAEHLKVHPHHALGEGKPVVYQVFTRLFGNTNNTNKPWGTIAENGVGKFSDFDDKALQSIKDLGASYVWYTGVPHHAVINDYTDYGIDLDDPDVVKGRAGSPYAVKDYYSVNPDLANDPSQRLEEFEALVARTHKHGLKVIIDIVPNHVARHYQSLNMPDGVSDFGANDDTSVSYARDNNFYYVVGESFKVPASQNGYSALGGDNHPLADGEFDETPAKWTGNGARAAQPDASDWYETVKINYGVKPDGSYDFERLPQDYRNKSLAEHAEFWKDKSLPDSWVKFKHIVHFWLDKGVDGFRYDMAEMVPVEFWSYLNSSIKQKNPDAFLLAEVYNPSLYRDYLQLGKMDYLYDKVEFYDSLKLLMQGRGPAQPLEDIQNSMQDIELSMLHFLENHDEQRIASPEFAGDANIGRPAMVVSSLISRSPTMLYFAQDLGEDGSEDTGFGDPSRTTIFDYAGVPAHQRFMNDGKFDGGKSTQEELALRAFYTRLMNISASHPAMLGAYKSLHSFNASRDSGYTQSQFSFIRWTERQALIIVSNFEQNQKDFTLHLPVDLLSRLQVNQGQYSMTDLLNGVVYPLNVAKKRSDASIELMLKPLESVVLELDLTKID